jgi:hypothetical protein
MKGPVTIPGKRYRLFAFITGFSVGATRTGGNTRTKKRYRMNAARWREQAYIE